MEKPKIAFMPCADQNAASTRIRVFFVAAALRAQGFDVEISRQPTNADVLVIQKRIDRVTLQAARQTRESGGRVIYDLDDCGAALDWLGIEAEIECETLSLADSLTVDTDERLAFCAIDEKYKAIPHKAVVPDCIDYFPWLKQRDPTRSFLRRTPVAVWFGNRVNFPPASAYLTEAVDRKYIKGADVFTNRDAISQLQARYPALDFHSWDLHNFPKALGNYDCSVLIHDSSIEGQLKSNNKMLVSLAAGVVPFVSDTPAYRQTAYDIGCSELVVSNTGDLMDRLRSPDAIGNLRSSIISSRVEQYLQQRSPFATAEKLIKFIEATS